MSLSLYTKWYKSKPLLWRIKNQIKFRFGLIWSAITGSISPEGKFLLNYINPRFLDFEDSETLLSKIQIDSYQGKSFWKQKGLSSSEKECLTNFWDFVIFVRAQAYPHLFQEMEKHREIVYQLMTMFGVTTSEALLRSASQNILENYFNNFYEKYKRN